MDARLPLWRRLRRHFWYVAARAASVLVGSLPAAPGRRLCRELAWLAYRYRRQERELARANLELVFPERPAAWRERLLHGCARALGENLHAALTLERQAARGFPDVAEEPAPAGQDLAAVLRSLQARGRGALLITAHLGCWELLGAWLAARLDRPAVVTTTVRNPAVDRLLQDRRRAVGLDPLPREAGIRPVLRALARGAIVGVLVDQNVRAPGSDLAFLGRPAPTALGPFRLAARRGVPLVPAVVVRVQGRWLVRHAAPIWPRPGQEAAALAVRCNEVLSRWIVSHPEQWVWYHDRWNLRGQRRSP